MSVHVASRVLGVDRKMVRKMLSFSVSPGYCWADCAPIFTQHLPPMNEDEDLQMAVREHQQELEAAERMFEANLGGKT